MENPLRIAAVFATMGRPETASGCVKALAAQSRPPDLVIVAANDPRDGTIEALAALPPLPFKLKVHPMSANRGNAGGVEEAMALAIQADAEALWVLDDDSWPRPDALAVLEGALLSESGNAVIAPLQVDPDTRELAWPLMIESAPGNWELITTLGGLPAGAKWPSRPSWTGTLYPRAAIEAAGAVNGELFIRGEDDEYTFRVASVGWQFILVRDAVLDHPGPKGMVHETVMGKHFFWEPRLPLWKLYYKVRNLVWMKRRSGCFHALAAVLLCARAVRRHDAPDSERWMVFRAAVADGWSGRLGRKVADWAP